MKRLLLACALAASGLAWLVAGILVCPLAAAMRGDIRVRRSREHELDAIGYDDNDPGANVDECSHMLGLEPGSCARCEGT